MAQALCSGFTYLKDDALTMAGSLQAGGYSMTETSVAVKALFPNISAAELADILMQVFDDGASIVQQATDQAKMLKEAGIIPQEVSSRLKAEFTVLTATEMAQVLVSVFDYLTDNGMELAQSLKAGQYNMLESAPAIKAVIPNISAADLTDILMAVFDE
jgi:hypothetical protein